MDSYYPEVKESFCGVYLLYCLNSKKFYVGSSVEVKRRIKDHLLLLNKNKHNNPHLQSAWNLYGSASFLWYKLEECSPESSLSREQYYIDEFKALDPKVAYNLNPFANGGSRKGHTKSAQMRKRLGESRIGCKLSEEHKRKIAIAHKGKTLSAEHKTALSVRFKGRIPSENTTKAASKANSKSYEFTGPEGNNVKINNLRQFCFSNNLCYNNMQQVINGKYRQHKGYCNGRLV